MATLMERHSYPGKLIVVEGIDGSGKSTQADLLATTLRSEGRTVVSVREPGSTPVGERVRDIVLHAQDIPLAPNAQALLYSTARAQLRCTVKLSSTRKMLRKPAAYSASSSRRTCGISLWRCLRP